MNRAAIRRPGWLGVAMILAGGAILRFWNITAGLPYKIGVDEPVIANHAIQMMKSGDFNPHFFDYPGLYLYVQLLLGCARFLVGASAGMWRSLDQFYPDHLFLWARALNAAIGTMTILIVYRAGSRWGQWSALLAALLMAVWPNHVRESHFALTDVPMTFLTALALLLSLRARESGEVRSFLAAGASVGLAAATKYPGAIGLVMPLIAAASTRQPRAAARNAFAATAAAGGAYLLGAPYTVLDMPAFLNSFAVLSSTFRPRPFADGARIYTAYLIGGSGWFGGVMAAVGVGWGVVCGLRDRSRGNLAKWALLIVFPLVFFTFFATKNLIFGRYLLPLLPFVCLLTAIVVVDVLTWVAQWPQPLWIRTAAAAALLVAVLYPPARQGIDWPRHYGAPTTQDIAYRLIRSYIPEGSAVVVECPELRLPRPAYRVLEPSHLTARSPEEYVSTGVTFLVASSDALGSVLRPVAGSSTDQAYRELLNDPQQCLPTVEPTAAVEGPRIWICRLQTP
jgi:4-amino-4-deoxy-L-arabinose transferase-like glycosyltransferase